MWYKRLLIVFTVFVFGGVGVAAANAPDRAPARLALAEHRKAPSSAPSADSKTPAPGSGVSKDANTKAPHRDLKGYAAKAKAVKAKNDKNAVTPAMRQAAAKARKAAGAKPMTMTTAALKKLADASAQQRRGGTTQAHFYGPYANYANSPWRMPDVQVSIDGDGTGATASAEVDLETGAVTGVTMVDRGAGYTTATVTFSSLGTGTVTGTGAGATGTATIDTATGQVTAVAVDAGGAGYVTPGVKKFVNTLPGLGESNANDLGQYIPVAVPDTTTYAGSDYYEIGVVEYSEKVHRDLPAAQMRGYVQLSTAVIPGKHVALTRPDGSAVLLPNGEQAYAVDNPHQYGPFIQATKDKAVRVLFRNLLATGANGNLRLPVDHTVMGAGMGPDMGGMTEPNPQQPMCGEDPKPRECFSENRATIHLHGGITPWISDGTPHQWITPAGEDTAYPKGVSVQNVPDMPDPGPGAQTFFYTNQQSARLMFFHDHAWGITRLNVYAGMSAGYSITDPTEAKLKADGILPAAEMPLILSDKTFTPDTYQLAATDPLWDAAWGGLGALWAPHVYVPAQMPGSRAGANPYGRWAYSPWFWPPPGDVKNGPVDNVYFDPACDPAANGGFCEPRKVPGTPQVSMGMEAFNDTPLVNGTVYPTVTLDPKSYRFRILNAAGDRFFNLSLYQADASGTEVALKAAQVRAAKNDPAGTVPEPDETKSPAGPDWIQVGTDGGFLPTPAVLPAQPITWVTDPTVFNAGNVDKHSLLMGPAERTDVVVDFSQYAGKTLILYNDSPAAFPARDPRYDYYTDNADLTSTGGAPTTPKGYGPNTRTVMQIKIAASPPAPAFNLTALRAAFAHHADGSGVFESSQNPIVVGQEAYNAAYGTSFGLGPIATAEDGFARITDFKLTFDTLSGTRLADFPFETKAIQDETGEAYDKDYGRMSGNLGLERPMTTAGTAQNLTLYPYVNPSTELLQGVPNATRINSLDDGTQIWKITHNGVDTHPIHIHLLDFQLINRVGWDGIIRPPDDNEIGWKDTIRVSPLEDTIVAVRPILPKLKWGIPDSVRPLDPSMPLGTSAQFQQQNANGVAVNPPIVNAVVNFGWEYVWHCHILSHEEMDMMRPMSVTAPRAIPLGPTAAYVRDPDGTVHLEWVDPTPDWAPTTPGNPANEIGFRIERAEVTAGTPGGWTQVATALANQTSWTDTTATVGTDYAYRVIAWNVAGATAGDPALAAGPPNAPAGLTASATVAGGPVNLAWHGSVLATSYAVERATDAAFTTDVVMLAADVTGTTYADATAGPDTAYWYRVKAVNASGESAWSEPASIRTLLAAPTAPASLSATMTTSWPLTVTLRWPASPGATGYQVERSTTAAFTSAVTSLPVAGTALTVTDSSAAGATAYFYRVRATAQSLPSDWTTTSVTTPSTTLTAVAGVVGIVAPTGATPTGVLTWTPQPWAPTYTVQRSTSSRFSATSLVTTTGLTSPTLTAAGLTSGTTYYFRVRAEQPGGVVGAWSTTVLVRPQLPARPASLTITLNAARPGPTGTIDLKLVWPASATQPLGEYVLQRSTASDFLAAPVVTLGPVTGTTLSFIDTGLDRASRYYYRIAAKNSVGTSGQWRTANFRTPL